jgi:predicted Zn-dependent protease
MSRLGNRAFARAGIALALVAGLFGCVTDGDQGGGGNSLTDVGFLSGFQGTDLEDIKGKYVETIELKNLDYSIETAEQDRDLTLALTNELGRFESKPLDRYVNGVLAKIAKAAADKGGVTNFRPHAVVYANPNPDAFATPSGMILVSHGLLERVENEDQLAFILAHESSHALLRHHDKDWFLTSQQHTVATGEVGVQALGGVAKKTGDSSLSQNAEKWQAIGTGVLMVSRDFIVPSWSRNQEDQADLLGIDLMAAAGYQPRAAVGVIDMMAEMQASREEAAKSPERQAAEKALQGSATGNLAGGSKFFGQLLDQAGAAIDDAVSSAKASYRSPEERKALARNYARREYRTVRVPATVKPYQAALAQRTTKLLLVRYRLSGDALRKLNENQPRAALNDALKGVKGTTSRHSYPRVVLSRTYSSLGNGGKAMESLRVALTGPEPALQAYLMLAEMQANQRKFADAIKILEQARQRYPESALAVVQLVSVQARAGKRNEAAALSVKCRVEFPEVKDRCIEATKGKSALDQSA